MNICLYMTTVLEHAGGFENSFMDIARDLSDDPLLKISIVTMDEKFTIRLGYLMSIYFRENLNKNPVHREPTKNILERLEGVKYVKCSSFKELRTELSKADIIYSKNEILESIILKVFVKYRNLKSVVFLCGTTLFYPTAKSLNFKLHNLLYTGLIYKFLTNKVQQFHVKNKSDKIIINKLHKNVIVQIINNPFNLLRFKLLIRKHKFHLRNPDSINLTWIGRLEEQKGLDRLKNIIEILKLENVNEKISWNIVGNGTYKGIVEQLVKDNHNVFYYGQINNDLIPSLLSQSDLLVITSRAESFGNTILEANAAKISAYSYDIPGPHDLIKSGYNGELFNDTYDYIEGLKKFIANYSKEKSKRSFDKYLNENFDKDIIANKTKNLLLFSTRNDKV